MVGSRNTTGRHVVRGRPGNGNFEAKLLITVQTPNRVHGEMTMQAKCRAKFGSEKKEEGEGVW